LISIVIQVCFGRKFGVIDFFYRNSPANLGCGFGSSLGFSSALGSSFLGSSFLGDSFLGSSFFGGGLL